MLSASAVSYTHLLYDAEPEPEEPTRVFQAITEEGAESGDAAYARARNYARADEDDAPARRSFQDSVLNPLMARLAAVAYRVRCLLYTSRCV